MTSMNVRRKNEILISFNRKERSKWIFFLLKVVKRDELDNGQKASTNKEVIY